MTINRPPPNSSTQRMYCAMLRLRGGADALSRLSEVARMVRSSAVLILSIPQEAQLYQADDEQDGEQDDRLSRRITHIEAGKGRLIDHQHQRLGGVQRPSGIGGGHVEHVVEYAQEADGT